jgi:hypothetical protein
VTELKVGSSDAAEAKLQSIAKWRTVKSISRIFHLISVAYILGQTFNIFLFGHQFDLRESYLSFILEMVFMITLVVSGVLNMWSILRIFEDNKVGKARWIWSNMIKIILTIFYTRVLDVIILSWVGTA